jgi:hypothetical protein
MQEPISLNGTAWRCTDGTMDEHGMTCTVMEGAIMPDWNGENEIEIKYEDGTVAYMKYRRFTMRFTRLHSSERSNSSLTSNTRVLQPISLNGTLWRCTDDNMIEYGMTCTVIDGEIHPDWNGENDIEIEYQNGNRTYMKYRRFCRRFKRIQPIHPPTHQTTNKGAIQQSRCRPFFF